MERVAAVTYVRIGWNGCEARGAPNPLVGFPRDMTPHRRREFTTDQSAGWRLAARTPSPMPPAGSD
jgi:hypothetical protein